MTKSNPLIPGSTATTAATPTPMPGKSTTGESFEVDLTDVQSGYAIPDGLYRLRCLDVSQEVSKSGNPMFVWNFVIVDGQYAGKEFKLWTVITPAAMWKIAETVISLGIGQQGQKVTFNRSDVVNKECGALLEQDEYNGNINSKISKTMSIDEYLKAIQG